MKTLKQLLEAKAEKPQPLTPVEPDSVTSLTPKTKDEKRFMDKHVVKKIDDRAGNGDDVFRATNINVADRASTRHGYNPGQDQAVYESKNMKTLKQILGEKTLTPNEMKKREEIAKGIEKSNPDMPMGKKMAIATAKAKQVAEEVEQLDERAAHDQYHTYHKGVKDVLAKIGMHVDAHSKAAMSPTNWNKEKGGNMHGGHVHAMKTLHRTLQDLHDNLQQDVEYAQPPKPLKEDVDLFDVFAEDVREEVKTVYESLDDDNKQVIIEMIEAEDYDTVVEVVKEVVNG
jgi:hypothetical protein